MKTIAYIDGFNLYYGAVKGTPYKWLNIAELCHLLLPKNDFLQFKYFTARRRSARWRILENLESVHA